MLKKRIVLVDADESFRLLLSSILKLSEKVSLVAAYDLPEEAVKNIAKDKPEIVITDLSFPFCAPVDYIRVLVDKSPFTDILVVTNSLDSQLVMDVLTRGAKGYVLKTANITNIIQAVESMAVGGSPIDQFVARKLLYSLQLSSYTPLTSRESSVLKLITEGKTYSTIANELQISPDTAKTHIKNIYRKLQVSSKTQAVRKAMTDRLVPFM